MSFNLDDLLNSALDELEEQQNEKRSNTINQDLIINEITSSFKNNTTLNENNSNIPQTTTTTTTTTTSTTTTNTTTSNNNNNESALPINNETFMKDVFDEVFNDPKMKELIDGYSAESGESFDPISFKDNMKNLFGSMGGFGGEGGGDNGGDNVGGDPLGQLGFDGFGKPPGDTNNDSSAPPPVSGIDFKDFESNVGNVLKGMAENAANSNNQTAANSDSTADLLKNLASMMSQDGEDLSGMGDSINDFYDESMKYIVENIFSSNDEKAMGQNEMLDKISLLGQLPEAFCDQYCKDIQNKLENPN
ncbi:peroxin 19 [Heterostelium album PN500]|uniref:Peroxin 19 n=1 Tax=Heterostelium pallidum (strain ATCC 26659 / Pp 5 / PN500) TaxID=670386 RepID=D3AZP1_HETP5|nr:peroxin 19 [Heterostelium album PN500]EFA85420.1 peroxin 19 [Heterostelium album PN500]|eukprot:XP_020437529.1 peroxin 19 [Heterostelium album PN500]